MTTWTRALALLLTLGLATPARAGAPLVDYVVQPGDTCETVTRKLYGSSKHIDLLHANNKLGPRPHHLKPGMVLRVPQSVDTDTGAPPGAAASAGPDAVLSFLRNEVDAYTPTQHPGRRDEPLSRGHRVNTHTAASAEITFADESRIQLGEQSLIVILGGTRSQVRSKAEDTTLVTGSLRAHLGALAGKPRPLALATPSAEVSLEPGEAQVSVDAAQSTRLAVHRGSARLRAQRRSVVVPEQHGSKAARGQPPTPPRPLPAAPVWTSPPPPFVLQRDPGPVTGTYAAGVGLPGAQAPAGWHVEVASDDRFNDLIVDTRAPAEVTRLELRVPPGRYHARVSAIDGDQFEGRASELVQVVVASVTTVPAAPGQPAQLVISPGCFCALDDGPLLAVQGPLVLRPGRAHALRCAGDATGAGATHLEIPASEAGAPQAVTRVETPRRIGDDAEAIVRITLRDAAGAALPELAILTRADPGVQLGPLTPGDAPGEFRVQARWSPGPRPAALLFTSDGGLQARVELPALPASAAPATSASRMGGLAAAGIGLLVATVPVTAIGVGLTLSPLRPYHDDPQRRLDLRPAGISALSLAPVLLIGGVTLLLLDRRAQRRVRLAPQATPTGAGLLLDARF